MTPSGQRIRSPGAWNHKTTIAKAEIVSFSDVENHCRTGKTRLSPGFFLTEFGNVHPINTDANPDCFEGTLQNIPNDNDTGANVDEISQSFLLITWNEPTLNNIDDGSKNNEEMLTSVYNLHWLQQWAYDQHSIAAKRLKREVSLEQTFMYKYREMRDNRQVDASSREKHLGLIGVDYNDLFTAVHDHGDIEENMTSSSGLLKMLDVSYFYSLYFIFGNSMKLFLNNHMNLSQGMFLEGAVMVTNAPDVATQDSPQNIVRNIGNIICLGPLSHGSLYGDTFHVKSTSDAVNVAYTSLELCPHQDLAYYESKPGFQMLHCASMPENIIGGESILIDCMAAAHKFRDVTPDLFEVLVKCPATFVKQRKGAIMTYSRPHIVLANHDNDDLNDMNREIVSVHWAPPFEGPLHIHPDRVEDYFKAYAAFELMLDNAKCPMACSEQSGIDLDLANSLADYARENTWQYRLKPGEVVVFNNTRMLHGRRAFEIPPTAQNKSGEDEERHLIGAYTNIDDSLNRYRVLLHDENEERIIPNVGNGSMSILPGF